MLWNFSLRSKSLTTVLFSVVVWLGESQASPRHLPQGEFVKRGPQAGSVKPRFAYVCNEDSTIEIYTQNPKNGALRPLTYINAGIYCGGSTMDASKKVQ